jgi:hypothetical protein
VAVVVRPHAAPVPGGEEGPECDPVTAPTSTRRRLAPPSLGLGHRA